LKQQPEKAERENHFPHSHGAGILVGPRLCPSAPSGSPYFSELSIGRAPRVAEPGRVLIPSVCGSADRMDQPRTAEYVRNAWPFHKAKGIGLLKSCGLSMPTLPSSRCPGRTPSVNLQHARSPLWGHATPPDGGDPLCARGSRRRQQGCPPKRARSAPYRGKETGAGQHYFGQVKLRA